MKSRHFVIIIPTIIFILAHFYIKVCGLIEAGLSPKEQVLLILIGNSSFFFVAGAVIMRFFIGELNEEEEFPNPS